MDDTLLRTHDKLLYILQFLSQPGLKTMDIPVENLTAPRWGRSAGKKLYSKPERPRIVLAVCPYDGEVVDQVTHKVYKPSAVKYMPLGLLSLAASIADYDVSILDGASRGMTVDEMLEEIESLQPDILGLSVVTYRAWAMREILRRSTATIKVVGGPHATENYNYILQQGADAVFVGDAEETFPKWLKEGCPLKCIYCDVQQKKFYAMFPERILAEFKQLKELGATAIHILDDAFNIQKERVIKFCDLSQKYGIDILGYFIIGAPGETAA